MTPPDLDTPPPQIHFRRYGRTTQLVLDRPEDLAAVLHLDEGLWLASAAPAVTLNLDAGLLARLSGPDGRVHAAEVKAAIRWMFGALATLEPVAAASPILRTKDLRDSGTPADAVRADLEAMGVEEADLDAVRAAKTDEQPLASAERLLMLQRWLLPLANSFVSCPGLYAQGKRAAFEMGTLILNGRHFTMAVRVPNREQHATLATASNLFILYAEVAAPDGTILYEVALPVTSGGRGGLRVGQRGILRAIDGNDYHARIVQIVENPISLWEATLAPFKRLSNSLMGTIEKIGADQEADLIKKTTSAVQGTAVNPPTEAPTAPTAPTVPTAPPKPSVLSGSPGTMLAGGSVAVAALGSSAAFVSQVISELGGTILLSVVAGALGVILLPIVLTAATRLSQRDLRAVLQGSGWAINPQMRLTRPQARHFTHPPRYPAGSRGLRPWQRRAKRA